MSDKDKLQFLINRIDNKIIVMNDLLIVQGMRGNWDCNDYMRGMYNGMELMLSVVEERDPVYKK